MFGKQQHTEGRIPKWFLVTCSCVWMVAPLSVVSQTIGVQPNVTFSIARDIVGLAEQQLTGQVQTDLSLTFAGMTVDIDDSMLTVLSRTRLALLADLRSAVTSLPESALKDALNQALNQAEAVIAAIRGGGNRIAIDTLNDELKIIEDQLDDNFVDIVGDNMDPSDTNAGRLLALAKPIEQRYDYLQYITNKIRLYARDAVKDQLASLLRRTILDQADGDSPAYRHDLEEILTQAEESRGTLIKEEEVNRIRYKADLLLRKTGVLGTERACDADLSTTISGIDLDGTLSWESNDYRAPSRDVRSGGFEIDAGFSDEYWDASIHYSWEDRDYPDRLKDDDDKITRSLDLTLSWKQGSRSADAAFSYDDEFYPNNSRRRNYNIDVPVSLGFPLHGGDLAIAFKWESKTYPANSLLDHETFTEKASYSKEQRTSTFSGYVKREALLYPNATGKNRYLQEWGGTVESALSCGDLTLTVFHQTTTYPHISKKNQSVQKFDLNFAINVSATRISTEFTNKITAHPNDMSKPTSREIGVSLAAALDVAQGTFEASWSNGTEWNSICSAAKTTSEVLTKETHNAELSWDGDITDDLKLSLSVRWKNVINWAEREKDSANLLLQIEFTLSI